MLDELLCVGPKTVMGGGCAELNTDFGQQMLRLAVVSVTIVIHKDCDVFGTYGSLRRQLIRGIIRGSTIGGSS